MKIFQLIRGRVEPEYFHYPEDDENRGWIKPTAVAGAVTLMLLTALLIAQFAGINGGGLIDASRNPNAPAEGQFANANPSTPQSSAPAVLPAGIVLHPDLVEPFEQSRVNLAEAVSLSNWLNSRPAFMAELPERFSNWFFTNSDHSALQEAFTGVDGTNLSACASALGQLNLLTAEETGALILWLQALPPLPPGVEGEKFAMELSTAQAQCTFLGL